MQKVANNFSYSFRGIVFLFALISSAFCYGETLGSNHGVSWQIKTNTSKNGPTVAIIACSNLNGPADSLAIHQIQYWEPAAGSILCVDTGGMSFDKNDTNKSASLSAVLDRYKPDWVIELWESYDYKKKIPHANGCTINVCGSGITSGLKQAVLAAAKQVTSQDKKEYWSITSASEVPGNSVACQLSKDKKINFVQVVTTSKEKNDRIWRRVRQHRYAAHSILEHLDMLNREAIPDQITAKASEHNKEFYNIAIFNGSGAQSSSGHTPYWILRSFNHLPDAHVALVGPEEIQSGILKQFDSVLFGGGLAGRQSKALGESGREKVKEFVSDGGRYVGICAGAFLASARDYGLHILNADMNGGKGSFVITLDFTEEGERLFNKSRAQCKYSGGPVKICPAGIDSLPAYTVLATFDSLPEKLSKLHDTAAVIRGQYGKGYVIAFSPHPERFPGPQEVLWDSLRPKR